MKIFTITSRRIKEETTMTEQDLNKPDDPVINPNPQPGVTPVVRQGVEDTLKPSDPRHPDYDPMKDRKVIEWRDKILSVNAQKDAEIESLKRQLEGIGTELNAFREEKKKLEDKDKSDLQRASERIAELEKERAKLESQITDRDKDHSKAITNLNARLLVMQELNRLGIKANSLERKGLEVELEKKLSEMKKGDDPSEITNAIVSDFAKERETSYTPPPEPRIVKPDKIEPTSDEKQLKELSEGKMTPEKEAKIKEILERMEKKK